MCIDHAALTSLLNSAHFSGKLARWALAIQEMNLVSKYRTGKKNANADTLFQKHTMTVCAVKASELPAADSDTHFVQNTEELSKIHAAQREDPSLMAMCKYLEHEALPCDEDSDKTSVLDGHHNEVIWGVLYYKPPAYPGHLCVVIPAGLYSAVLEEIHAGSLIGYFAYKKV